MDLEARLEDASTSHSAHPQELRLWLRMLTCTQLIEKFVRTQLRKEFGTTLPRFDLMSQLERSPVGLKMNELSRRMMVTSGNITGIADQLTAEGLVERVPLADDRRAFLIRLTKAGRAQFALMAKAHEQWIVDALAGLSESQSKQLHTLMGHIKQQFKQAQAA
ncbi:MAG: MarR family transcriptional regulator [Cytophagales bacterium]|nr:MarR family transcriptional regulator [Cytophagales bacterium]